jgi:hypothetical protein
MGPVDQLGPRTNELVVAQQLEILEDLASARRGEPVAPGRHPGDRHRVVGVGLASRRMLLALAMAEEGRDLAHLFTELKKMAREPGAYLPAPSMPITRSKP